MSIDHWTTDVIDTFAEPFDGPRPLAATQMGLPPCPGVYLVVCGPCLAHVGTSGNLRARVGTLARLSTHGGAVAVLSAALFTEELPMIWWREFEDHASARALERQLKVRFGEPPRPSPEFDGCVHQLLSRLVRAAGEDSWAAGFIEAVFRTGAHINLLADRAQPDPRLQEVWRKVGIPIALRPWIGYFDGSG